MVQELSLQPWYYRIPLQSREKLRISALVFTDIIAFTVVMLTAAHFDRLEISSTRFRIVVPIFAVLLFGLIYAKRYTGGTAPIGQMGSLVRYSMFALIAYVGVNIVLFHSLGSIWVALAWVVFPMVAMMMRQTAAIVLGHSGMWSSPALLVGSPEATERVQAMLRANLRPVFHIVGITVGKSLPEDANGWSALLAENGAQSIVVAVQGLESERPLLASLQRSGVRVTKFVALPVANVAQLETAVSQDGIGPVGQAVKTSVDLAAAIVLLIATAPLLLLVAALIKLDGGPVLFRHERVGLHGRAFYCLKFRTMVVAADQALQALLARDSVAQQEWEETRKLRNDPRVTQVGRFLRATSLDELPQLLNVLHGEMSLVGPRPIVTAELTRYGSAVGYYLATTPGLTGLWQISGRSDTSYERRVQLDIAYVRGWSFWKDVTILYRTLPAVVLKRGAV